MSGTVTAAPYVALITSEHQGQQHFTASVVASVQPFADLQNALLAMPAAFDIAQAVGAQLDAIGVRVGRSRYVATPLTGVYFAWDTPSLGWDQGYWRGLYEPTQGVTALDDTTYRLLLLAVIGSNTWDGTVVGAAAALANLFNASEAPGTLLFVQDNQNMTMTFGIAGQQPPVVFLALLSGGYIPFKPAGVAASYLTNSVNNTPIFGFDVENGCVSGWDTGTWGVAIPT